MNVAGLETFGRTAKEVSPTRPLVTLWRASGFIARPNRGAAELISHRFMGTSI